MRVAHVNRVKLQTFTNLTFGRFASPWARDIDRSAPDSFLETLSLRTGASLTELKSGMLPSYEGIVFERHNANGNTPWVLPLGIYHRTRKAYGMQYCPECLFWDETPYFRRRWRFDHLLRTRLNDARYILTPEEAHHGAEALARSGASVNMAALQRFLGHTSEKATATYRQESASPLPKTAEEFDRLLAQLEEKIRSLSPHTLRRRIAERDKYILLTMKET